MPIDLLATPWGLDLSNSSSLTSDDYAAIKAHLYTFVVLPANHPDTQLALDAGLVVLNPQLSPVIATEEEPIKEPDVNVDPVFSTPTSEVETEPVEPETVPIEPEATEPPADDPEPVDANVEDAVESTESIPAAPVDDSPAPPPLVGP